MSLTSNFVEKINKEMFRSRDLEKRFFMEHSTYSFIKHE